MHIRNNGAFTFFEIMMVLVIIAVLSALFYPKIRQQFGKAERSTIKLKMNAIKNSLTEYRAEVGKFPSTKETLRALVTCPDPNNEHYKKIADRWPFAKEEDIQDRAGNEFAYRCPPEKFKGKYQYYEILYLGPTQSEDDPEAMDDGA
jgi:general secretion pathway protein G